MFVATTAELNVLGLTSLHGNNKNVGVGVLRKDN